MPPTTPPAASLTEANAPARAAAAARVQSGEVIYGDGTIITRNIGQVLGVR